MVTDGSRLYYVESPFVSPVLTQVSTLGGETSAIPTPFPVNQIGDISPDRSALLIPAYVVRRTSALWVLPLPAGTPRRLGGLIGHDGTWSPDGQRILFANGHDLYVARTDGTESKKLDPSRAFLLVALVARRFTFTHFRGSTQRPDHIRCGKFRPTELIFIRCFPAGTILPRNVAVVGHRMGSTSSFSPTHNGKTQIWAIPEKGGLFRKARWEPTELTTGPLSYSSPFPAWMERNSLPSALSPVGSSDVSTRKPNSLSPIFRAYQQTEWTSPGMGNG